MRRLALALVVVLLASCSTTAFQLKARQPLSVGEPQNRSVYHVHVKYLNQDDNGLTQSVDEIDARVLHGLWEDANYYRWIDYKTRSYPVGPSIESRMDYAPASTVPWKDYPPAIGFEYLMKGIAVDEKGNLNKLPDLDSIPRDMTGFHFYINLIDFHSWDIYRYMLVGGGAPGQSAMRRVGDSIDYDLSIQDIPLMSWPGVSSDLRMQGGTVHGTYLADTERDGKSLKIIYYEQNQRILQNVYGKVGPAEMKMPYEGTTRFYGHIFLDQDNSLWKATLTEYVYSKVFAPVLVAVVVHSKREYTIERTP